MKRSLLVAAVAFFGSSALAQQGGDPAAGKLLAEQYCSRCHDVGESGAFKQNPPSFAAIAVYWGEDDLGTVLRRALRDEQRGLGGRYTISDESLQTIAAAADGDARRALNLLELAADLAEDGEISANVEMQPGDILIIPESFF